MRLFPLRQSHHLCKAAGTRNWIIIGSAVAAFLLYATAAAIVAQGQRNDFIPERSSLAAAVSNVAYGAPLGKVYADLLAQLLDFKVPLNDLLAKAKQQELSPGALLGSTSDGNGIGYIVVASLGMRVFGMQTSALLMSMLTLMAASGLAFLWRFRERYAAVVVLYFASLTVMLFTPLTSDPDYRLNIGIAGIRYFSLVAILPSFHLLVECIGTQLSDAGKPGTIISIGVQTAILLLAVLVRNSAVPLIGAIGSGCLLVAWRRRSEPDAIVSMGRKLACVGLVGMAMVGILTLSVSSAYVRDGRFTETLWHRIFLGFGVSPEWPFGNVRELYDCKRYIPEGIVPNSEDRNAHCVWWDYATRHNIPVDTAVTQTYSREYDVALREAFFRIAWLYPAETMRTFFYWKPQFIVWSIAQSLKVNITRQPAPLLWLLAATVANLFLFSFAAAAGASSNAFSNDNKLVAGAALLFAAFSTLPYFVVWGLPHTTGDLLLCCIFLLALLTVAVIERVSCWWLPWTGQLLGEQEIAT